MEKDAGFGKPGKKILVVGQLGYHEKTVVEPILNQLEIMGAKITRSGGNMDFFIKDNQENMIWNWVSAPLACNLKDYDVVFFVDYWNMSLPLFLYKKGIENPTIRLLGLCHGTVRLEEDVANRIPCSEPYEEFLKSSYDTIVVPDYWLKELMGGKDNFRVVGLPIELQFNRGRRFELPPTNRIVFAHRFAEDKGSKVFLEFVRYCRESEDLYIRDTEFVVTSKSEDQFNELGIIAVGRLDQKGLKELCSEGGYAWSSVRSETFGYTILDLCSYGLTPLLNGHPAYKHFPQKFKYSSFYEAQDIMKKGVILMNYEWDEILESMKNNSRKIAEVINGSIS